MSDYKQLSDFAATELVAGTDLIYSENATTEIEQKTTVTQLQYFILSPISNSSSTDAGTLLDSDTTAIGRAGLFQTTMAKIKAYVLSALSTGSSPTAGALTGAEIVPVSRGSGLLQTTTAAIAALAAGDLAPQRQSIPVLTAGQANYVTTGYTPGIINVFIAGVRISPSGYQATDGTNITITDPNVLAKLVPGMTIDTDAALSVSVSDVATVGSVQALDPANMPAVGTLTGAELMTVKQSGSFFQSTLTKIAQYVQSLFAPMRQSIPVTSNGQATYATTGYTVGMIDVFITGIRLNPTQYQALDGTNVTITDTAVLANLVTGMTVDIAAVVGLSVANAATVGSVSALIPSNQPTAATFTGTEQVSMLQGAGLVQNTLSAIGNWIAQTYLTFANKQFATLFGTIYVNAPGDYTGSVSSAGTGTDARAVIQAALNAATSVPGTGYYNYLSARRAKVKMLPGNYYISAPAVQTTARCESIVVPPCVQLDLDGANLYFDYPTAFTYGWSGICVGQYGSLRLSGATLSPSRNNAAPAGDIVFDAVRFLFTDSASSLEMDAGAEITGWTAGACVRGIGAWVTYLNGTGKLTNGAYGAVWSNFGTAWQGVYTLPTGNPTGASRVNTDVFMNNFSIVNMSNGGLLGTCTGNTGTANSIDFANSGFTFSGDQMLFENIGTYAVSLGNAYNVRFGHISIEECGNGDGMFSSNTVRNLVIEDMRVNLAGRVVTGPSGSVEPYPSVIFKNTNLQTFNLQQLYLHNTYRPDLALADNEALVGFNVGGIFPDATVPAAGPMFRGGPGSYSLKATWNSGHLVLGTTHLWQDGNGNLRKFNGTAPSADTAGDVVPGSRWRREITPYMGASANVNWTSLSIDNAAVGNSVYNSDGSQNDSITFQIELEPGTWTIFLMHTTGTSRGIYSVSLAGTVVGTIDGYNTSALRNTISSVAGVVVTSSGPTLLSLQMLTKNASSSGYLGSIQQIVLQRTT